MLFILGLFVAGGAWAYNFNDITLVQPWKGNSATGGAWTDVIGDTNLFDTFGANWNGNTLSIFTNWNPNKDGSINAAVKTANLFIDNLSNGSIDFSIQLDTLTGTGKVYQNPTIRTSQDIFAPLSSLTYGGRFDNASPSPVPVQVTSGNTGSTSVLWTIGSGGLNNRVDVDLSSLSLANQWDFVWGTATCANDTFSAQVMPVPEPLSLLLLGSGLIGLAGFARKKLIKK